MQYDAIIIGAGMSGMYQLHLLRQAGLSAHVLEAGTDVGGTWYWNRYPGARFDSETYTYCYSFSQEVLEEWDWKEHFAPQTETLPYLRYVADKFDLRKDITFGTRIAKASWDEKRSIWTLQATDGRSFTARFVVTAIGILSIPVIPDFPGRETFEGRSFHTADWPRDSFDLTGKRVAVFGTGATGIQVIQEVAKVAAQLTVYQREGNWAKPLHNAAISADEMAQIRKDFPSIFARCKATSAGFLHDWTPRDMADASPEEREALFEELYNKRGFSFWLGNYQDLSTNIETAKAVGDFLARKIRQRVKDPVKADILIPKNHPFGTKRVPMETGYYEVYNQPNVGLVDLKATPVERVTAGGIVTGGEERPFDVIIYATGFDAVRGAWDRIDITGVGERKLIDKWQDGPVTYMGLQMHDFPNLLAIVGPHSGATFCNVPRCIEQNVEFIAAMLTYAREKGITRIEATEQAENDWTDAQRTGAEAFLASKIDSWFTSINTNLPGRNKRGLLFYTGGQQYFLDFCQRVVEQDYDGFEMTTPVPNRLSGPATRQSSPSEE
jgi:cation diffusion facilitator CzcD-associated flavoprotein CzcO